MNVFQAFLLGILQGLTEFLPVSSSGHLILLPSLLGWEVQSLAFDTVLHLGTALALIVYFWSDLLKIIKSKKFIYLLTIGSLPAVVLGWFLGDFIELSLRSAFFVAVFLLAGTFIMWLAEKTYNNKWSDERIKEPERLSPGKSFLIGVFQSAALLSGISRSGATISGGMFLGLTREAAARFSFILSIPIVIMAGALKIVDSREVLELDMVIVAGFLSSFLAGLLAIKYMIIFLKNHRLYPFIIYRLALAALVIYIAI